MTETGTKAVLVVVLLSPSSLVVKIQKILWYIAFSCLWGVGYVNMSRCLISLINFGMGFYKHYLLHDKRCSLKAGVLEMWRSALKKKWGLNVLIIIL